MGFIDMLIARKKQTDDLLNPEDANQETPEQKKARLAKAVQPDSSGTYKTQ